MAMLFLNPLPPSQCRSLSPFVFIQVAGEISSPRFSLKLKSSGAENWVSRFRSKSLGLVFSGALALGLSLSGVVGFAEAKVGVNKPELLSKEFTTVIDVAGFLSNGQP
ncbi:unnamed protein product [Arabis nemorensis]|uniref:Uncharacterized protein n=1 Tax=Arabis nemorensis TaxID=586526 RepID=A0A565CH94_9BRAS|nr:unnamed protein product [Arabis nemorensis]